MCSTSKTSIYKPFPTSACPLSHDHPIVVHTEEHVATTFNKYLAFDPTVSPHYEVFVVPHRCSILYGETVDPMVEESKLLTSSLTCALRVFSSRYGGREWRSFVQEGSIAYAVRKLKPLDLRECAIYWRGSLYVQRDANFVVRCVLTSLLDFAPLNVFS
jgi:hypothetical protein